MEQTEQIRTAHTPGPWITDDAPDAYGNLTIRPDNGTMNGDYEAELIATVYWPDRNEWGEGNANLIAAAPLLLAEAEKWHAESHAEPCECAMYAAIRAARGEE